MDRTLPADIQRKQNRKPWLTGLLIVGIIVVGLIVFRYFLQKSIHRNKIRTAIVEVGSVVNTIDATGKVIPAFEQLLTSPINAELKEVLVTVGSSLEPQEKILDLDKEFTLLAFEKMKDELDLKRNSLRKLKFQLEKSLFDLQIVDSIKALRINSLRSVLKDALRLQKVGGGTKEAIEQAELDLKIAELEKRQLENDLKTKRQSMEVDLKESQLQMQIQAKNLRELERKLEQAEVVAKKKGVLTWVNENIGSTVREGDPLAKVADLGSFRVEGSCSDVYADRLSIGMEVTVRVNDVNLEGELVTIRPSVENGILSFLIELEDKQNPVLRPNLTVDLFLITATNNTALRLPNGPAFNGKSEQYIFVLNGNVATRRLVPIGLTNFDFVEIKNNVKPGEEVIISDMTRWEYLEEIAIED